MARKRSVENIAAFTWPRGDGRSWVVSTDKRQRRPPLLRYIVEQGLGDWPQVWDNPYRPLDDAPRLYEEFADLGRQALRVARKRYREARRAVPLREGREPQESNVQLVYFYADGDRALRDKAVRFSRSYGPLRLAPAPGARDIRPPFYLGRPSNGILLGVFLSEAYSLAWAIGLAKRVRELEGGRKEGLGGKEQMLLQLAISARMEGVQLILRRDAQGRLTSGYSCDSLLTTMWLQFYQDFVEGKGWRACKGCPRPFVPQRSTQEFHDPACRNRYHARVYGKKSKDKKEV